MPIQPCDLRAQATELLVIAHLEEVKNELAQKVESIQARIDSIRAALNQSKG